MSAIKRFQLTLTTTLFSLLCCFIMAEAQQRPSYIAKKIELQPFTSVRDVNVFRQVLISPPTGQGPILWQSDTALSLPVPGEPYDQFFALAINERGYSCGDARKNDFTDQIRDVYFYSSSFQVLDVVPEGMVNPSPTTPWGFCDDLNNNNDVVGHVVADSGRYRAALWRAAGGEPVVLETLDDYRESRARAINDAGMIAIDASVPMTSGIATNRAFTWNQGTLAQLPALDGRAESSTWAVDINRHGWVAGRAVRTDDSLGSDTRATLWQDGNPVDLIGGEVSPGSYSNASALNDLGMVVISGGAGWLWHNDSLWRIDDLITNTLYADGTPVPSIQLPVAINNNGDILTSEGALLLSQPEGLVVNSTGDLPDLDPNDGRCYTGGVNSIGDDECTLRAALQFANANPGADTIEFRIPAIGTPSIKPQTQLPAITEGVLIDGQSQPSSGNVEVNGFSLTRPGPATGLVSQSGATVFRGLIVNGFPSHGIVLQGGGGNTIENCIVGTNPSFDSGNGNLGHGVYIENSSDNTITGTGDTSGTVIAHNGLTGIFVQSGQTNRFTTPSIFRNGGLGIDLAPDGVTPNDSADTDVGANNLVNSPMIDSLVSKPGQLHVYGSILAEPDQLYDVEVYINSACDSSGSGEGERLLGQQVSLATDFLGKAAFSFVFDTTLVGSQVLTAKATDDNGNSSEYSPCAGLRKLRLVDARNQPLADEVFFISKVAYDPPVFTQPDTGIIVTDSTGLVGLDENDLQVGDSIRVWRNIGSRPARRHTALLGTRYSVTLDNGKFHPNSSYSYHEINDSALQTVVMDHTTIGYSLVVSIEWDASMTYLQSTLPGFQNMTNYLYDLTDGQMRFDTVFIFDNRENWAEADMVVYANNQVHPHVDKEGGVLRTSGPSADPVELPRRWFGSPSVGRHQSFTENPLALTHPDDFRTRVHEFGHYALRFLDEYRFSNGQRCSQRAQGVRDYGFMDCQYSGCSQYATEMSSNAAYAPSSCQNTEHWIRYRRSCWAQLEWDREMEWNGVFAPIIRPAERSLPGNLDYLPGPNNNPGNLDHDVGQSMVFPVPITAPAGNTVAITVRRVGANSPLATASVLLRKPAEGRTISQGMVDSLGRMRVLGATDGDEIIASGRVKRDSVTKHLASAETWFVGEAVVGTSGRSAYGNSFTSHAADSLEMTVREVAGEYPLVPSLQVDSTGATFQIDALNLFAVDPTVDLEPETGIVISYPLALAGDGYAGTLSDSLGGAGQLIVRAVDDSGAAFFFATDYTVEYIDSNVVPEVKGPFGNVSLTLDSTAFAGTIVAILNSPYPTIRTGLDPLSLQASNVQSVAVSPAALQGETGLTIRYAEDDLIGGDGLFGSEISLRIFHWDRSGQEWQLIGGSVDTTFNEVSTAITEAGTYAVFSTSIATDAGEDDGSGEAALPDRFEVFQNYPNPFNPVTVISYRLPVQADVSVEIYNILGRRVRRLVPGVQAAGAYELIWDATDGKGRPVASGIYFYKLTAGELAATRKMLLLK